MILYIEVNGDVSSHAGRPALPNIGLGNLHDRKGGDGLSHPGPASEHHSAVLRLPAQRETQQDVNKRSGLLARMKSDGFRGAHGTTAYLFTFAGTNKYLHQLI